MIYQKDWLMRQIESMIQMAAKLIFQKDTVLYEIRDETDMSQTDLLFRQLTALIEERRICEAEDLLFDNIDEEDDGYLELALDFYRKINQFTDEELLQSNFSREEISSGIAEILRIYDISV